MGFDRGFYAAPCGFVSGRGSELTGALRSALVREGRFVHVYAGAGIVPGSDPSDEFAEINLKMRQFTEGIAVIRSGLETPESRMPTLLEAPLLGAPNADAAGGTSGGTEQDAAWRHRDGKIVRPAQDCSE